mgnify:CR=1 FL=1
MVAMPGRPPLPLCLLMDPAGRGVSWLSAPPGPVHVAVSALVETSARSGKEPASL